MDKQKNIAHILIDAQGVKPTKEVIRDCAQRALTILPDSSIDLDGLIEQLEADYQVFRLEATSLTNNEIKPWLKDKKGEIKWSCGGDTLIT
ncbi:MAG: hypothetical protein IPO87_18825 [Flavobacteriales bacterium]|nr:hypothetical protein [Flavobacteriales bacterium]